MPQMKAISLWQPWATLIAIGVKQYETRSWATSYRGLLAIHAAKRPVKVEEITFEISLGLIAAGIRDPYSVPLGAILCIVRLVDVVTTESLMDIEGFFDTDEYCYGNYDDNRYAWKMEVVKIAPEPISVKGAKGLWTWEY